MMLSLEDKIACEKMIKNSNDENDKVNCAPGWARNNSYKKQERQRKKENIILFIAF